MKNTFLLFLWIQNIFLMTLIGEAINWSTPVTISSDITVNSSNPQVWIDSLGNATATWIENGFLLSSSLPLNGNWSSPEKLSTSGVTTQQLVVDLSGNATVLWVANNVLYTSRKKAQGNWTASQILSKSGASFPNLTVDSVGNIVAIWVNNGAILSSTKLIHGSWQLNPDIISSSGDFPQVAIGEDGTTIAVWHQQVNSIDTIYSANKTVVNEKNGNWSSPVVISNNIKNSNYPQVAVDSNGNTVAGWYQFDVSGTNYSNVIFQCSLKPKSQNWNLPIAISSSGMMNPANLVSALGFDMANNILAVWTTSYDGASFSIQSAFKSSNGNWDNSSLTNIDNSIYDFNFDFDSATQAPLLAYMTLLSDSSIVIKAAKSCSGMIPYPSWNNSAVISTGTQNGYPNVASTSNSLYQNVVAVWINYNGTNAIIQAASGSMPIPQPPFQVSVMQQINNKGIFVEYFNQITWQASPSPNINRYYILRNGVYIAQTDSNTYSFIDHNRIQNEAVTYSIVAMNLDGDQSVPAIGTFPQEETLAANTTNVFDLIKERRFEQPNFALP